MHNRFTLLAAICVFGVTVTVTGRGHGPYTTGWICPARGGEQQRAKRNNPGKTVSLRSTKPIWPKGRETEKNLFVGFRAVFERPKSGTAVLRITGSSLYRISLNGRFLGHGPARGPHGYWRVDQWPLKGLGAGENVLAVEVAGYNVNSYYLLDQPSFIQAEIVAEGRVLASTAGKGVPFEACILKGRVQKVQRYSFQRPFIEYYRLEPDYDR